MGFDILLIMILIICVITDLKHRKIYNKVVFPGLILAFSSHLILGGWQNLGSSLIGFVLGLALLLIPFLLGGMGAGDVKLLALIGALKGSSFVFNTAIYMGMSGGIMAIFILMYQGKLKVFLKSLFYYLHSRRYGIKAPLSMHKETISVSYPYGLAIACGAVLTLLLEGSEFLW